MSGKELFRRNGHGERIYCVKMALVDPNIKGWIPSRTYPGDAGHDLAASELVVINPGEFRDVPTNIRICLPAGIWGRITGRSSTLRIRSLLVNEGIIDNGYRGELRIGAFNLGGEPHTILPGERIAQLILQDVVAANWVWAENLETSERSDKGFGSTGL